MRLLLIRHATAVPSGTPGIADDDRPLTPRGRAKFRRAARGLARLLDRPDVLLTSPLPRAERALAHRGADAILVLLQRQPADATVVVVGHEPVLSLLLAQLLGSGRGERFAFKKGGAALVDLPDGPGAGGRLVWFLKPRILRIIAGA